MWDTCPKCILVCASLCMFRTFKRWRFHRHAKDMLRSQVFVAACWFISSTELVFVLNTCCCMSRAFTSTIVITSMACRCISKMASSSKELFFNGVLLRVEKQFRERICFSIACFYMSRAAISSTELFFNGVSVDVKCHCTSKAATSSTELFFKGMPLHVKNGHFEHVVVFQLPARVISRMKLTKIFYDFGAFANVHANTPAQGTA